MGKKYEINSYVQSSGGGGGTIFFWVAPKRFGKQSSGSIYSCAGIVVLDKDKAFPRHSTEF